MTELITLTCPSCGSKLKITEEMDRFACISCGNEHIVKRGEGTISLQPVVEGISKVQVGVDKTASELAIVRLKQDIYRINSELYRINYDQSKLKWYLVAEFIVGFYTIGTYFYVVIGLFLGNITQELFVITEAVLFTIIWILVDKLKKKKRQGYQTKSAPAFNCMHSAGMI